MTQCTHTGLVTLYPATLFRPYAVGLCPVCQEVVIIDAQRYEVSVLLRAVKAKVGTEEVVS